MKSGLGWRIQIILSALLIAGLIVSMSHAADRVVSGNVSAAVEQLPNYAATDQGVSLKSFAKGYDVRRGEFLARRGRRFFPVVIPSGLRRITTAGLEQSKFRGSMGIWFDVVDNRSEIRAGNSVSRASPK